MPDESVKPCINKGAKALQTKLGGLSGGMLPQKIFRFRISKNAISCIFLCSFQQYAHKGKCSSWLFSLPITSVGSIPCKERDK